MLQENCCSQEKELKPILNKKYWKTLLGFGIATLVGAGSVLNSTAIQAQKLNVSTTWEGQIK
ncbi:MAG: hypothetical protein WBA93_00740 [Microcoleaceae cyanobacterium]